MKQTTLSAAPGVPASFVSRCGSQVTGFLSGFDRLRFRATLGMLFQPAIMEQYLSRQNVLLKDFKDYALGLTERIKAAARRAAVAARRPEQYLPSALASKEELARAIAQRDRIKRGLIVLFSTVEPCLSYTVRGNRAAKKLELLLETRKCTHLYHYFMHPDFGLMHVRVQTWFPFSVDLCLNGREWLARQMDRAGLRYEQRDNCFVRVSDPARAQALLDEQLRTEWPKVLGELLTRAHPLHAELSAPLGRDYYWSASQTEFATDVMFRDAASLAAVYPKFLHHGIRTFGSADILRFLGRAYPGRFRGEVTTTLKRRPEGVRLKHQVNANSLKMYDKQGRVLRVETTIVNPGDFRVFRPSETDPEQQNKWQVMRRGVADLWRRAEVSRAANARYLTALASTTSATALAEEAQPLCRPRTVDGRRHRALNPWSAEDAALLEAVSAGEFALHGVRNRDLRARLFSPTTEPAETRRQSAAITRRLALLRAHRLIKKVNGTHRWVLTDQGRRVITALLTARQANIDQLTKVAA
jgi:hypothetical protein